MVDVEDAEALTAAVVARREGAGRRARRASAPPAESRPRTTPTRRSARGGARSSTASSRCARGSDAMDLSPARAGRYWRATSRWGRLLVAGRAKPGIRVFYGHDRVPRPGERAAGGTAKAQKLAERFPNHPTDFSILYLGTTWLPRDLGPLLRVCAPPARADRRQSGRRRLSGVGGRPHRGSQRASSAGSARRGSRRLPERVLEAVSRRVPG